MAEFTIRTYGDPVLRTPGEPVREFGPALRTLGDAMLVAMRKAKGIGLAAPQVGLSLQLFVADVRDPEATPLLDGQPVDPAAIMPMLFANAEVTVPAGEPATYAEGCLSFPGITGDVPRIERAVGRKALRRVLPMQAGEMEETVADASLLRNLTGFEPSVRVDTGVAAFVDWYRDYFRP